MPFTLKIPSKKGNGGSRPKLGERLEPKSSLRRRTRKKARVDAVNDIYNEVADRAAAESAKQFERWIAS